MTDSRLTALTALYAERRKPNPSPAVIAACEATLRHVKPHKSYIDHTAPRDDA